MSALSALLQEGVTTPFARLHLPEGFAAELRLERLAGQDAMSAPFEWTVQALGRQGSLDVESLLGQPAAVELECPDTLPSAPSGSRFVHGLIAAAGQSGTHGRFFRYAFVLRPWLWFLTRTTDCRIFQELSAPEIAAKVFADHAPIARFESRLRRTYAKRRYCVQYRESDYAFVARLLEQDGIGYHFEHARDGHTLVLTDPGSERPSIGGSGRLTYHAADGRALGTREIVSGWHQRREVRPGQVVLADFDFKKPNVPVGGQAADPRAHEQGDAEAFDYPGAFYNDPTNEGEVGDGDTLGDARAKVELERREVAHVEAGGTTNARSVAAGHVFTLTGGMRPELNGAYLVTATDIELRMTGFEAGGFDPEADAPDPGASYECRFRVLPAATPFRPQRTLSTPHVAGPQTATVVGPADEEIYTDSFGRVKLRFHWDRNPGVDGRPAKDEDLTAWVRVSQPWAGQNWGGTFLPRIGQEVLVDFLEGDPDRPLVTGRLFNAAQRPTAFSAAGSLPDNRALAGLRSKELHGTGYNELVFDDTPGALRTKLSSEAGKTQLNLGFLVHPRDAGAEPRGEGFELRTDDWGALRAAKGLFLSTDGRHRAVGGSLDRAELVRCLEEALKLAKGLAEHAESAAVDPSDPAPRETLAAAVRDWGTGANDAANGSGAGGKPVIGLSAPAGIVLGTPEDLIATSGANTDLVAQKNHQFASALQTHVHAGTGIRLFAHTGGIKVVANHGKLLAQAQHEDIVANAAQNIDMTATDGHVLVQAAKHVTLVESGGAYVKIAEGNIELGCPGTFTVKAAQYRFVGPTSASTVLPTFSASDVGRSFQTVFKGSNEPAPNVPFRVTTPAGTKLQGETDADGRTPKIEQAQYDVFAFVHTPRDET